MRRFRSTIAFLTLPALALGGLLAGCDGGGSGVTRVHFHMVSHTDCVRATVEVDLAAADAVLARTPTGAPDCAVSDENLGCPFHVVELNGGSKLFVSIDDCGISEAGVLFSCNFTQVDLERLDSEPREDCSCRAQETSCYSHGHCDVCPTLDADGRGCEICDNESDDDADGKADCDDPDCEFTMECGFGRTTITCSTTSTTTTTSTSTTSTTPATTSRARTGTSANGVADALAAP